MRVFFLSEDELIGSMGPAPGSYNPHEIYGIEKKYQRDDFGEKFPFKQYMKNFKDSEKTKREKTKEEIQRQSQKMEEAGYKNYKPQPLPLDYETFQHKLNKLVKMKKVRQKKGLPEGKGFGGAGRFEKDNDELLKSRIKLLKAKGVETKLAPDPGPGVFKNSKKIIKEFK